MNPNDYVPLRAAGQALPGKVSIATLHRWRKHCFSVLVALSHLRMQRIRLTAHGWPPRPDLHSVAVAGVERLERSRLAASFAKVPGQHDMPDYQASMILRPAMAAGCAIQPACSQQVRGTSWTACTMARQR